MSQTKPVFCERATASYISPWHIRIPTDGLKLGGGAKTPALCGAVVAWDLKVPFTDHHLGHCCRKCAEAYRLLGVLTSQKG